MIYLLTNQFVFLFSAFSDRLHKLWMADLNENGHKKASFLRAVVRFQLTRVICVFVLLILSTSCSVAVPVSVAVFQPPSGTLLVITLCMLGNFFKYLFLSKFAKNLCFQPMFYAYI